MKGKIELSSTGRSLLLGGQMLLLLVGFIFCIVGMAKHELNVPMGVEICICYFFLIGYAAYGYRFPIFSLQILVIAIAATNCITAIESLARGMSTVEWVPMLIANLFAVGAGILLNRHFKISQILLATCVLIDIAQFVLRLVFNSGLSFLYYAAVFQFLILDGTLMLVNYSYHAREREKNREEQDAASDR